MTEDDLFTAAEATWPAARAIQLGPWTLREGQGGGKRVSSATADGNVTPAQITEAEQAMQEIGQPPLFQIRPHDVALDTQLDCLGYRVLDPVNLMTTSVASLAAKPPRPISAFVLPEPLAIMNELWAECGIGPGRWAVMDRVTGPKTNVLGRSKDRASGAVFAAVHKKILFCHALEVLPVLHRQGSASNMLRAAAIWAQQHGAETAAVFVLDENSAAKALFSSLGFTDVGHYHYRMRPAQEDRA